ncbi:MAG: HlyD family efflux transporter periplasmic adaptor subunit [Cytophagia bacterium]|nr:MAG: HlyD family efflux transporter periplasmic adaptor subunit [Cytophagales bacterium]TAG38103.1 MAG: HlyD family efflux transporter periplasmic adaptor subunit [Cytophagia bacterium]TAG58702.1 MAG: HlyD family efflux transporter periplasmic adaptor subunit [Runella slithyformis]TAG70532.1 MAG: HlyD family efflux transporter periplasmic adaptor subunit [Runella slithyformis]TAG79534.1 MAG: HlyD family efflux transporter periplasmic adaptor subunit [Cytophagales bacterium]
MAKIDEIDAGSEAIRDYMEQIPSWILRWGICVIFLVLLSLAAISWFMRYPTVITTVFRLTSDNAPKPVVVRSDGRLVRLFVQDNQAVRQDSILGFMEATADHEQVLTLQADLKNLQAVVEANLFEQLNTFSANRFQKLGELQAAYQAFMQSYTQTLALFANGYYTKRKDYLRYELSDLEQNHDQFLEQYDIHKRDAELAQKEFEMNKKLYKDKVIATLDVQREESKYINKQLPVKQLEMAITNNMTTQTQKKRELTELERQAIEQKAEFGQALNTLQSEIRNWERRFILRAPTDGKINFSMTLQENQSLRTGTEMMYVGGNDRRYFGEINIPQVNFGKVKKGQRVLVKLQGYPFEEFGAIEGQIATIAQVPTTDNQFFLATVTLPNGLITSTNKKLNYKTGMIATAEIITEDLRLIERIFYQLRGVFSKT